VKHVLTRSVMSAFALGAMIASAVAADKLVVSLDTPPQHYRTAIMQEFLDELKEASDGALASELFHSSQLYALNDVVRAVARADVGLTVLPSSYLTSVVPDFAILDLPVLNGLDSEKRNALNDGALGQALAGQISNAIGVVVPGNWWEIGSVVYFASKELDSLDDFEGMRIRIPGTLTFTARVEAMGATGVPLPFTDTPLALQQGVVDALVATPDSIISNKLTDAGVKYAYWDFGLIAHSVPLVSKKYWESLTEEQRKLFTTKWNESVARERQAVAEGAAKDRAALEALGVTWTDASEEDVRTATERLIKIQPQLIEALGVSDEVVATAQDAVR
jgi:TRAP-type C4-dicarboxylate transport system substrate-binding protein